MTAAVLSSQCAVELSIFFETGEPRVTRGNSSFGSVLFEKYLRSEGLELVCLQRRNTIEGVDEKCAMACLNVSNTSLLSIWFASRFCASHSLSVMGRDSCMMHW